MNFPFTPSVEHLLRESRKHGIPVRIEIHPEKRDVVDCLTLMYRTNTGGHVLVYPKYDEQKISKSTIRHIIKERDVMKAFEKARAQLEDYQSGELTPFLGTQGHGQRFYYDEKTVKNNPRLRFHQAPGSSIMMRYGDAYRLSQLLHPEHVHLVDLVPPESND